MLDSSLIILTNYFPFYKGEEYLETELPILATKFERIFIIACMIDDTQSQTREVPDNVVVIPSGVNHGRLNRVRMVLKSLTHKAREQEQLSLSQKLYSKYFESRSQMISEQVIDRLSKYSFEQCKSVVIYSYWLYITARVGIELKNQLFNVHKPKIITRTHRYDLYEEVTHLSFLPERQFLLSEMDAIYPVSDDGTNYLRWKYSADSDKIQTRRLGTIKPAFTLDKVKGNSLHLVSCSALRPVKRVDLIIEAVALLQAKGFEIHWTHIGDGELYEKLQKLAQKKLSENSFHFAGFIRNHQVLDYYHENKVDVFLNVSESEGVPVSIMEAISIGLPVIATDVGGTKEIVEDEVNGILLGAQINAIELSEAVEKIYNMESASYRVMCEQAISVWKLHYDGEKNYQMFADELSDM